MLTRQSIIDAGLALVRSEGLGAIGLRSVAVRLGVTPMALYRYVADSTDLRDAVIARILAGVPTAPGDGDWPDRYERWAVAARAVLATCPGVVRHVLLHWFESPRMLDVVESLLAVADDAGLTGFEAVASANAVLMFVLMRVEAEHAVREGGAMVRELSPVDDAASRLPLLAANRDNCTIARIDEHFNYGLRVVLNGIAARGRSVRC